MLLLAVGVVLGCKHDPYVCNASAQCVEGGITGTCQPSGFCSFPDAACESGERYESNAGDGLAGQCVDDSNSATCGAVGQECCAGSVCVDNAFCEAAVCNQCVTDVAHGTLHSCFLKHDGTVSCSGLNMNGELGNGGTSSIPTATPTPVRDSVTGLPMTGVVKLGNGEQHTCAIKSDATVWCWGGNANGVLGNGTPDDQSAAVQVVRESDGLPLTGIVDVAGSFCRTCALDNTGGVWCWGCNDNGELGDATGTGRLAAGPVLVAMNGVPFTGAVQLAVGGRHACARTASGDVFCWGDNDFGEVGDDTQIDVDVPKRVFDAATVAAGRFHTCAARADGSAFCWGSNRHRRLGTLSVVRDPDEDNHGLLPAPVVVDADGTTFPGVSSFALAAMSCTVTTDQRGFCWGDNLYGQTGTGTGSSVPMPVLGIDGKPLTSLQRIVAGYTRACAFTADGRMHCWGRNHLGQLGDGTFINRGLATPAKPSCP